MKDKVRQEIERAFNPEFLNRVDDIIVFHPLSREEIGEIVHILLAGCAEASGGGGSHDPPHRRRHRLPGGEGVRREVRGAAPQAGHPTLS